jgi:hypothetical protein
VNDIRRRLHPEPQNRFDELPTHTAWTDCTGLTEAGAREMNDSILGELAFMSTRQMERTEALLEYRIENLLMDCSSCAT